MVFVFAWVLQAKAKAVWLENRARGAQQCEQRLVQLHSAINSIDAELCASLDQDLYGDELPELCQVSPPAIIFKNPSIVL